MILSKEDLKDMLKVKHIKTRVPVEDKIEEQEEVIIKPLTNRK